MGNSEVQYNVRVKQRRQDGRIGWTKATAGWVKLNYNGVLPKKDKEEIGSISSIGVLIRDEARKVIAGVDKRIYVKTSLEAEAALAISRDIRKIVLETDSEIIYRAIIGKGKRGIGEFFLM